MGAAEGLGAAQLLDGGVGFRPDRGAHLFVLELGHLLVEGAGGGVVPSGAGVVEVPVFEGEGEAGADGGALAEDAQALGVGAGKPLEAVAVDFRLLAVDGEDVVQDGAAAHFGELLLEGEGPCRGRR